MSKIDKYLTEESFLSSALVSKTANNVRKILQDAKREIEKTNDRETANKLFFDLIDGIQIMLKSLRR